MLNLLAWLAAAQQQSKSLFDNFAPSYHPAGIYHGRSHTFKKNLRKLRKRQSRRAFLRSLRK